MFDIKSTFYHCILNTRLHHIARALTSKSIRVIMYHGIVSDDEPIQCWWQLKKSKFIRQIRYLKKHFNIISLNQACNLLYRKHSIPPKSIVITFDDGYRNYLTHALPILKNNNIPSTIYIPTGPVVKKEIIWADQLYLSLYEYDKNIIDLSEIGLGYWPIDSKGKKQIAIDSIINLLKDLPANERRNKMIKIYDTIDTSLNGEEIARSPFVLLEPEEIKLLSKEDLITIGSHSVSHEPLTSLSFEAAVEEIHESKKYLEKITGMQIEHFCYPAGFYNDQITWAIKKARYRSALLAGGFQDKMKDMYHIPRIGIGDFESDAFFECQVNGVIALKDKIKERVLKKGIKSL